jgi:uncharacterized protein YaiE (UPF0345 family)
MKTANPMAAMIAVAALSLIPRSAGAQDHNKDAEQRVISTERLGTSANFTTKDGQSKSASVILRQVSVFGKEPVDPISEPGFHLMTLRAGKVTTVLDGKEEGRNPGDVWTVPENTKFSLKVEGETAVLDIVSVIVR